jgi:hypothetical protein
MFNLSIIDNVQFKWLNFIKSIFEKTGLNYLWNQQQPVHSVQLKFIVKQNLTDQYIQNWFNQIENSSRGEFYGIFKNEFNLENYLLKLHIYTSVTSGILYKIVYIMTDITNLK